MQAKWFSWGGYLFFFFNVNVFASTAVDDGSAEIDIPEPMTLKYALTQASQNYSSDLMTYQAQRELALADKALALSNEGTFVYLNGRLRYVDPSPSATNDTNNDNRVAFDVSRRLYDFGQSESKIKAAEKQLESIEALYLDYITQRKLAILQAYFNVLIADVAYSHANEKMAIDFLRYDDLKEKSEFGQVSDVELLKAETIFRESRRYRFQALSDQRRTRARLSQLVSPGHLPDALEKPELAKIAALSPQRKLDDLDKLLAIAFENNPALQALELKIAQARLNRQSVRAEKYPVISAHLQAADYQRELNSSDRFRAGIEVSIPIYQAGQVSAKLKQAAGKLLQLEAEKQKLREEIEEQLLDLWLQIGDMQQQLTDTELNLDYHDLKLEKNRALYEMEAVSNLGNSMVELTQAQLFKAQFEYKLSMAWARLDALLGRPINYFNTQ
jgi:outer membrane protein TolC